MKKTKIIIPIICIIIPLAVGFLSSVFAGGGFDAYGRMDRPPLSPPPAVFPIVWTILYVLMGISSCIIFKSTAAEKTFALRLYAVNLFLNFLWPIIFFGYNKVLFAFVCLILLLATVIWMALKFYKINKKAGLLNVPYILWLIFAAYLNLGVYLLN